MNTLGYIKYVILDEMKSIKEEVMESKILTATFILIIIGLIIYLRPFPERQVYFYRDTLDPIGRPLRITPKRFLQIGRAHV